MSSNIRLDAIYVRSPNAVTREIGGELVIVPLTSDVGSVDDELYGLNEVGTAIWQKLDGTMNLSTVIATLAKEYAAPTGEIEGDVIGFAGELLGRGLIEETVGERSHVDT